MRDTVYQVLTHPCCQAKGWEQVTLTSNPMNHDTQLRKGRGSQKRKATNKEAKDFEMSEKIVFLELVITMTYTPILTKPPYQFAPPRIIQPLATSTPLTTRNWPPQEKDLILPLQISRKSISPSNHPPLANSPSPQKNPKAPFPPSQLKPSTSINQSINLLEQKPKSLHLQPMTALLRPLHKIFLLLRSLNHIRLRGLEAQVFMFTQILAQAVGF